SNTSTYFLWNDNLIPFKIRTFIKKTITTRELLNWSTLKPFKNLPETKWALNFKILKSLEHNSQKYSFRIKILTNSLPTMENLNIHYSYLYTTSTCTQCSNIENILHLILCSNNNINI